MPEAWGGGSPPQLSSHTHSHRSFCPSCFLPVSPRTSLVTPLQVSPSLQLSLLINGCCVLSLSPFTCSPCRGHMASALGLPGPWPRHSSSAHREFCLHISEDGNIRVLAAVRHLITACDPTASLNPLCDTLLPRQQPWSSSEQCPKPHRVQCPTWETQTKLPAPGFRRA